MSESLESEDEEKYEVLTDASGKEIGYIDTYERDERDMRYCIRLDDGSYMDVDIYTIFYEGFPDIHEWSEVEEFLCSGNQ